MPKDLHIEEHLIDLLAQVWSKDFDIETLKQYPEMKPYIAELEEMQRLGLDFKKKAANVLRDFEKNRRKK